MSLLVKSNELRKILIHCSKLHNIPFAHICSFLNIDYVNFLKFYLNRNDLNSNTKHIVKDDDIIKIATLLGIDIRIVIVKKGADEYKGHLRKKLSDAYKEKRIASEAKAADKRNSSSVE